MGCRCNERRTAIAIGIRASLNGNIEAAKKSAQFVAQSAIEDTKSAFQSRVNAARSKLARR